MGKLKKFKVTKRFEVWCEMEVETLDETTALAMAKKMEHSDFFTSRPRVMVNDVTTLDGTGICEVW